MVRGGPESPRYEQLPRHPGVWSEHRLWRADSAGCACRRAGVMSYFDGYHDVTPCKHLVRWGFPAHSRVARARPSRDRGEHRRRTIPGCPHTQPRTQYSSRSLARSRLGYGRLQAVGDPGPLLRKDRHGFIYLFWHKLAWLDPGCNAFLFPGPESSALSRSVRREQRHDETRRRDLVAENSGHHAWTPLLHETPYYVAIPCV